MDGCVELAKKRSVIKKDVADLTNSSRVWLQSHLDPQTTLTKPAIYPPADLWPATGDMVIWGSDQKRV